MKLKSSEPFWLIKNGLPQSYPSLRQDLETEVLIIGGGITGSLIAHQCMADGYKTVLIDRREIGHGSTSATTSMLQYEVDTALHELIDLIGEAGAVASYKACYASIDDLAAIAKEVKSDCGFKKKQSLYYAAYKKDVAWLKKELATRAKYGFEVQWMEAKDIEQKFGIVGTQGGILSAQGGSIDAFCLAHDLLAYNAKKGLVVYDKTDMAAVKYGKDGVEVTTDWGNTIKAKRLIYCNGFESTEIIPEQFVQLLSTYAIAGEVDSAKRLAIDDLLVWNTADPYIYMRTTDDNRLLIGGGDEDFMNAKKRDSHLNKKAEWLGKQIGKMLPSYAFREDFAWAGTFGATKDGLPYIGQHSGFAGAYFVLGFGGNGITFSVIGMQMVSAFLKGEQHKLETWFAFGR